MESIMDSRADIHTFIRQASKLMDDKVHFAKADVKEFNVMKRAFEISESYLGKDFLFLQDATSLRLFLRDTFGSAALLYFEDANATFHLDIEHALLFYYALKANNSPLLPQALGVLYFIIGHQLDEEFTALSKLTTKGKISPIFELDSHLFRWRRCSFILRKYMLQFSQVPGYRGYYFERSMLGQISYLVAKGQSFEDAKDSLVASNTGIFYPFLPLDVESLLIPFILSGHFDTSLMKGDLTSTLISDMQALSRQYNLSDVYNVHNQFAKPVMIEMMGKILTLILSEIEKNGHLLGSDVILYHLSPMRVGFLVKDWLSIENVLPTLHRFFKPVEPFDLEGQALTGDFL